MTVAFSSTLLRSSLRVMALSAALALVASCSNDTRSSLQGYAEGEFVNVAAPAAGALTQLSVKRGQKLEPGAVLFTLDSTNEEASRREAAERLKGAEQRLANLQSGRRAPEVQVVTAQAEQAAASRKLSLSQLQQQEKLFAGGFISRAALDQAHAQGEEDREQEHGCGRNPIDQPCPFVGGHRLCSSPASSAATMAGLSTSCLVIASTATHTTIRAVSTSATTPVPMPSPPRHVGIPR